MKVLVPAVLLALMAGCASRYPLRTPTQERLPSIVGESLAQARIRLPEDLSGRPAVLLVAFEREAQFDVDRWILGLMQLDAPLRILEVPTIPGLFPGAFSEEIDEGMRGGIPQPDWGLVVTLYDDEAKVMAAFTGNEARRRNARVLGLDEDGVVRFFHDAGYSPGALTELVDTLTSTRSGPWYRGLGQGGPVGPLGFDPCFPSGAAVVGSQRCAPSACPPAS